MEEKKLIEPGKWYVELDDNGNISKIEYTDSYRALLGYSSQQEYLDANGSWEESIHPEDRERVDAEYIETVKKHPEGRDYDIEYRIKTKWGYRWFHDYAHCIRSEDGSLKRADGVIFDINDAKTMNVNLGAVQLSHEVLKNSNIGLWAVEVDEGCEPRMYGDEAMMKLIGVEGKATPEEVYHAWYDHIDKAHYDDVNQSVEKMGSGIHSEVQYPWHYSDGRTIIVRCGGIRNPSYTKGLRIEGVHRDVTNLSHYEREQELLIQVEESEKINESFINQYSLVFKVNIDTDEYTVLKTEDDLVKGQTLPKFFNEGNCVFINSIVYEKDRPYMLKETSYDTIRRKIKITPTYTIEYRTLNKEGVTEWHEMTIKALDENQIAIGISNRNKEIILDHLQEKMNEDYYALFSVDIDTQLITIVKNAPWYPIGDETKPLPYKETLLAFAKDLQGETKQRFINLSDINYAKKIFLSDDKRTFSYQSDIIKTKPWVKVTEYVIARHEDATPAVFTLGFSILDALETDKQKLQETIRQNMKIIGGMASEYLSLYYVNIAESSYKIYSINDKKLPGIKNLLADETDSETAFRKFLETDAVHPEDKKLFAVLTADGIKKLLAHKKTHSIQFRRNYGEGWLWTVMDIVKFEDIDEEPNELSVGLVERDTEIRAEKSLQNCISVLGKEINPDTSINELLTITGDFYGAERAYVFEFGKNREYVKNTYEWCSKGIEPMISQLQYIAYKEVEGWMKEFEEQGTFFMSSLQKDSRTTDEGIKILEMQGITSLIATPIYDGNEISGFIGVDNPTKATDNIPVIKTISTIIYSEILRRNQNDEEHITLNKLTDAFVSVYFVDLTKDYMRTWKIAEEYKEYYGKTEFYSKSMGGYVRNFITVNDRARCIEMTSPEYVLEQFKTKDRFTIEMTDIMTGSERNFVFDYIKINPEGTHFVICSHDLTDSITQERLRQEKLENALSQAKLANQRISHQKVLLDYFVESYSSAYSVDLTNNTFEVLHMEHDFSEVFKMDGNKNDMDLFIFNYIHKDDQKLMIDMTNKENVIQRLREESHFTFTVREVFNGTERTMRCLIVRGIDEYHIAVGFLDITEELNKQNEQAEQLRNALDMAESANRAKTTFLNNMSHDIRTPMNAIIGYTDLATSHIDSKEQLKDYLKKISISSAHLLSLINDVLDMSRIESGKMTIHEKEENLTQIINSLTDIVKSDIDSRQIRFSLETNIEKPNILCDKLRLNQILLNILSNAIKYTAVGGKVSMTVNQIALNQDNTATYEFAIKDNGMGMTKEFLKTIYDPFTRVKSSTMSGIQGTGLGMSITKNLVDMMEGSIQIESEPLKGTLVTITFNFKLQEESKLSALLSSFKKKSKKDLPELNEKEDNKIEFTGKKVLLVEDNEYNREIATLFLQDCGIQVFAAEDGIVAVEKIKQAKPGDYDLIFMDIQMPKMNGYEATKAIRALDSEVSKIPIIAMTANAFEEDRKMALEAGMNDHIAKPITQDTLKNILSKAFIVSF